MLSRRPIARLLQQQPARSRRSDVQQQQAGSSDFQPRLQQPRREQQPGADKAGLPAAPASP